MAQFSLTKNDNKEILVKIVSVCSFMHTVKVFFKRMIETVGKSLGMLTGVSAYFAGIVELVKTLGNSTFEREDEEVNNCLHQSII